VPYLNFGKGLDVGKKIGVAVALIVILAGAVALLIWRLGPNPQQREMARKAITLTKTLMDVATREKVTVTEAELTRMKREPTTGYAIDSKHGNRRLAPIMRCISCGAEIPEPGYWQPPAPKGYIGYFRQEYKCPVCGKPACEEGFRPPGEREPGPGNLTWPGKP